MTAPPIDQARLEALGPAERTILTLTSHTDHCVHNRPGMVTPDPTSNLGVKWEPVTWKQEGEDKVVYRLVKVGNKTNPVRVGVLGAGNQISEGGRVVGEYRRPGLYPEAVAWTYRQIADVWKLDNEFAAHFASWAFPKEHRDLKVVLTAFMLVQNRMGEPVIENGKVSFHDDDYRAIGEAMCLLRGKNDLNPKLLLRVGDVLAVPGVVAINRELGFGQSARQAPRGRYIKTVEKWLRNREQNPRTMEALVKAGFRTSVMDLAKRTGYKPDSPRFFQMLRWKQKQAEDGRRNIAIGAEVTAAETWAGLTEREICERITKGRVAYKRIVGLLPPEIGLTRAVMAAAVEAGSLSDADLIILTPTLEDLGLLTVPTVQARWKEATAKAENQRAANIAKRVKNTETVAQLQEASDKATAKALEEVTRGLRVFVIVDKSGSMQTSIEAAKGYLTKFLGGFPLDRTHISVFNSFGTEVTLKAATAAAVEQAFRGHTAGGGTVHREGIRAIQHHKPGPDEDLLMIWVGDEGEYGGGPTIARQIRDAGLNPVAFGLLKVRSNDVGSAVTDGAAALGIPCFPIDPAMFDDPYAVTRTLRNLISSTPVGTGRAVTPARAARKTLVQEILETPLLTRPVWV